MNIEYKKLQPEDSNSYREIRLECLQEFPERFGSIFEEQSKIKKLAFETYIEEGSDSHFIIGAFRSDKLIGICGFYQQSENIEKGEIIQMYVKPDFQGNGIGMQLLNTTIQKIYEINDIQRIELGAMSSEKNDFLIKFYKKAGFKIFEIEEAYIIRNKKSFSLTSMFLGQK